MTVWPGCPMELVKQLTILRGGRIGGGSSNTRKSGRQPRHGLEHHLHQPGRGRTLGQSALIEESAAPSALQRQSRTSDSENPSSSKPATNAAAGVASSWRGCASSMASPTPRSPGSSTQPADTGGAERMGGTGTEGRAPAFWQQAWRDGATERPDPVTATAEKLEWS